MKRSGGTSPPEVKRRLRQQRQNGKQADHPSDAGKFAMEIMQNMSSAKARFEAGVKLLKDQPQTDAEAKRPSGDRRGASPLHARTSRGA
jgi:hypothetical protein